MRSRYVISAAVLVAAACIRRRREAPAHPEPAAAPARDDRPVAAEPVAVEPGPVEEPEPVAEEPEPVVAERGRFVLGGSALAPGHAVVTGVTFASRREAPVGADALRLRVERALNVPAGGLIVLDDPGFAPDAEGFTLALAAAGTGSFAAVGTYELLADPSSAPSSASTGGTAR